MGRAWAVMWRYPKEGPVTFTTVVKKDSAYVYQKGRSKKLLGWERKTSDEVDKPSNKEKAMSEGRRRG